METINVLIWQYAISICMFSPPFYSILEPLWATKVVDSYREDLQRTSDEVKRDLEIRHEDELRERFDTNEGMMQEFTSSFRFGNFRHWYNIKYYLKRVRCGNHSFEVSSMQLTLKPVVIWPWRLRFNGSDDEKNGKQTKHWTNGYSLCPCRSSGLLKVFYWRYLIMYVILQRDSVMMISGEVIIRKE